MQDSPSPLARRLRTACALLGLLTLTTALGCAAEASLDAEGGGDYFGNNAGNNAGNNGSNNVGPGDSGNNQGNNQGNNAGNNAEPYIPEEEVFNLTVGFQVLDLEFNDAGTRAFVITRTGVSVIPLDSIDGDRAIPPIPVDDVDVEDETDREVEITGDGLFAFVRTVGLEGLNVVDLNSQEISLVSLSAIPTDLDIIPGQSRALAVIRGSDELALIDLPAALEDPESVRVIDLGDTNVGQAELSPDARRALLFTTVEDRKEITVVDLELETVQRFPLRKGIRNIAIGPESQTAVIFHTKQPGLPSPGEPEDDFLAKSWGYSVFDLTTGYAKIETLPSEPGEFAFGETQRNLYVLLNEPLLGIRQVEIIDLGSFRTRTLRLGSPPEHIGTIPNEGAPRIYISQQHPLGRMTFLEESDLEVKTVTGFELNSLID